MPEAPRARASLLPSGRIRSASTHARRTLLFLVLGALGVLGCDSTAKLAIKNIKFDRIQVVSAFPADLSGDKPVRVCKGPAQAIELNFNLVSTDRVTSGQEQVADNDKSIRPGDRVDRRPVTVTGNDATVTKDIFDLDLECVDKYPDSDIQTGKACQGAVKPDTSVISVTYKDHAQDRLQPVAIALLIDQSGSTIGLVNETDRKEDTSDNVAFTNFSQFASDFNRARLSQARTFIGALNDDDRLVVYTYNKDIEVACTLPAATEAARAEECFGTRRDIFLNKLSGLQGHETGRTKLWEAVRTAWDFLKENTNTTEENTVAARHIIVIGDGPDTCFPGSEDYRAGRPACASIGYDHFRQTVETEWLDQDIKISFIQFQAPGHREQDTRQWEVACETGGQYIFVNSEDMPKTGADLSTALREAYLTLRYSLAGVWKLYAQLPVLGADTPQPEGMPVGNVYGIEGSMRLKSSIFVNVSDTQTFSFAGNQDERLVLRKACSAETDCTGTPAACMDFCTDQSAICKVDGVPIGDTVPCEGGMCCAQSCEAVSQCPAAPVETTP